MTEQLIQDLKAARDLLATKGRCVGRATKNGQFCIVGAISRAVGEYHDLEARGERTHLVMDALRPYVPLGYIVDFNDQPTTTDQDVLNLFDKALAELGGLGD